MKKTLLTKREIIFVCLMIAVLLGLFISSSMTYQQQEIHDNKISSEDDIYRLTEEVMKQMDFILNVKNRRYQ